MDLRTERLIPVWGIRGAGDRGRRDAKLITDPTEAARYVAASHLGRLWYLHSGQDSREAVQPVRFDSQTPLNVEGKGTQIFGHSWAHQEAGMDRFQVESAATPARDLGYGYGGFQTDGALHPAESYTEGAHVLTFNPAAGGYLQSWTVGGTQILHRGNRWSRGLQTRLEWADAVSGRLTLHRACGSSSRYDSGLTAMGAPMTFLRGEPAAGGGTKIQWGAIPLEWDPDGDGGVPALSADHGGGEAFPVLWSDLELECEIWLNYLGNTGVHRLQVTWMVNNDRETAFTDAAAQIALCLINSFDEIYTFDARDNVLEDVTTDVETPDLSRHSYSRSATYEDANTPQSTATKIATGYGGIIARQSGPDLAVGLASRLQGIDVEGSPQSIAGDNTAGTQLTAMVRRAGTTGHDGQQFVAIGLDSALSSRWHGENVLRRIPKGRSVFERWIHTGTLAAVQASMRDWQ